MTIKKFNWKNITDLNIFHERQRQVIIMKQSGLTLSQVASSFGVSRQRIIQIQEKIKRKWTKELKKRESLREQAKINQEKIKKITIIVKKEVIK